MSHINEKIRPRQLRLIIEAGDFDAALHFYRDILGMSEQPAFATEGEDRVAILLAGSATIEISSAAHVRRIDALEGAQPTNGVTMRLALEVKDTEAAVTMSERHGLPVLAPPRRTPFQTINGRVEGPAGWHVTFFQELETLEERSRHAGFFTDEQRPR